MSEFIMPQSALTHKTGIFFSLKKSKPGYLPVNSLAQEHYRNIMNSVNDDLKHKLPINESINTNLSQLNKLDPSIPFALDKNIVLTKEIDVEKLPNKGCPVKITANGKKITDSQMNELHSGMTTEDVIKRFGSPTHCTDASGGGKTYWWNRRGRKGGDVTVSFNSYGKVEFVGAVIGD